MVMLELEKGGGFERVEAYAKRLAEQQRRSGR